MKLPFYWGSATSAHQVEGNNALSDWWAWEKQGKVKEESGLACDHYQRFSQDFQIAKNLGHNSHRFSLEWSRLEPEEGVWDLNAFQHYRLVLEDLKSRSIEPFVTLHHFTNPIWFDRLGGWQHPKAVDYFLRYVKKAAEFFGDQVEFWITINEPMVYLYFSYLVGEWPPGVRSYDASLKVLYQLIQAHLRSYEVIHHHYDKVLKKPVWVSFAKHMTYYTPCHENSWRDRIALRMRDWFVNDMMLNALDGGFLFFPAVFCEFLSKRGALDFIGINYYTRDFIRFAGLAEIDTLGSPCDKAHHSKEIKELNMMGWEVYPEGLYHLLKKLKKYNLPIVVTENGICAETDEQRSRFIQNHLEALGKAKDEGVDVRGYFYWSLLDNFEWAHGFRPRFGIVEVDYKTQERKIRNSAKTLTDYCRKISAGAAL